MKKKSTGLKTHPKAHGTGEVAELITELRHLILNARHAAASTINTLQVLTNFEIGRRIVEHEQQGQQRAGYGEELIRALSLGLSNEFGRGFSKRNLDYMRRFYLDYRARGTAIVKKASALSSRASKSQTLSAQFEMISRNPSKSAEASVAIGQHPTDQRQNPFQLSWSHYVLLLTIENPEERSFYEIEAAQAGWSLRELKRQVASSLYERLALSRDKTAVRQLAQQGQVILRPEDVLKDPYVLEFLGLDEKTSYSESELEQAIIDRIEHFLLELGKGFLFEARQRRFTFDEEHYFVDLVFYNRLLRCYVLIDLKLDKLTHQDLGQMQMYVNYFDRHVKLEEEHPTVGILLCKRKREAIVELTLPADANIHAKEYKLYLPSKDLLKQKLLEWADQGLRP